MGYVPKIKAENVFGKRYSITSALSREGKIQTRRGSSQNHFENFNSKDKYLSTTKSEFRDAYTE